MRRIRISLASLNFVRRFSIALLVALIIGPAGVVSADAEAASPSPKSDLGTPTVVKPKAPQLILAAAPASTAKSAAKKRINIKVFVTGYTYYDNTPAGSAAISHPVIHKRAGGSGTYKNPITVAVGHRYVGSRDVLDYPKGTRFYMPYLDRFFVVEDSCGDGPHPERGACHVHPKGTAAWFDIWINGKGSSKKAEKCAEAITGRHTVQINPPRKHRVKAGAVSSKGRCAL